MMTRSSFRLFPMLRLLPARAACAGGAAAVLSTLIIFAADVAADQGESSAAQVQGFDIPLPSDIEGSASANPTARPKNAVDLVKLRAKYDREVWSDEVLAQDYERSFTVGLWDRLIKEPDKFQVMRDQRFKELVVGTVPDVTEHDWSIQAIRLAEPNKTITGEEWSDSLAGFENSGYEIVETEWHHQKFEPPKEEAPARSTVSFLIHAYHRSQNQRYIVRGNLTVTWATEPTPTSLAVPNSIDATDITILTRPGNPAFQERRIEVLPYDPNGRRYPSSIHPVMVQDLDLDGLPEVVLGDYNIVYRNRGNWVFDVESLCQHAPRHPNAAVFADFTGDGVIDYFVAVKNGFPHLYVGEPGGKFSTEPRVLKIAEQPLLVPISVAVGDIEGDGDLDIFLGQQKPGYHNGDIPTPYFNALDGFPAYLLINDGTGDFSEEIDERGLGEKRQRRMFSASFIDLDEDGDLDLITTSDFSGTDLYENDGRGYFTDVSNRLNPPGYAFGMSHTFGDYNMDGKLDFMLIGMSSTTARRLEGLNLNREEFPEYNKARMLMGYGNRMYLGDGRGNFAQAPFNSSVARTGWSWGSTTLDFDNDADPDLFICNGQTSGVTTQDYCTRFWCHDVYYKAGERPDEAIRDLFAKMAPLFSGYGVSWNGYEHNALLMNLGGKDFLNISYLMGSAHEFDARSCVSGDLDADGRIDLLVEHKDVKNERARLFFLRNELESQNAWVGFRLQSDRPNVSPLGATITLELSDGRKLMRYNVTGHSVWAQHDNSVHFGLGAEATAKKVTVRWPNGETSEILAPEPGMYHVVTPPEGEAGDGPRVSAR